MPAKSVDHAERLLTCFRKAIRHDLSNQLVALQGMLHLVEQEELDRLSPEGQDYVQRAAAAARRAVVMVQTLKDLVQWAVAPERPEKVDLATTLREVEAEIGQLYPERTIAFDFAPAVASVTAGRQTVTRILVELVRLAVWLAREDPIRLAISSTSPGAGTVISVVLKEPGPTSTFGVDNRFEFLVARELAATQGASVAVDTSTSALVVSLLFA